MKNPTDRFLAACTRCGDRISALGGTDILDRHDIEDMAESVVDVLDLMLDGEWHSTDEICATAMSQREGLRRMRELRSVGFMIDKRRHGSARVYEYRLIIPAPVGSDDQLTLFGQE
jgi:hypothetical protein